MPWEDRANGILADIDAFEAWRNGLERDIRVFRAHGWDEIADVLCRRVALIDRTLDRMRRGIQ